MAIESAKRLFTQLDSVLLRICLEYGDTVRVESVQVKCASIVNNANSPGRRLCRIGNPPSKRSRKATMTVDH